MAEEREKLSVVLEGRVRKYLRDMSKAADATDDWADETEKAGVRADTAARKSERAFSGVRRSIRETSREAKRGATFETEATESGFSGPRGILARVKDVRKEASRGAAMRVGFEERGASGVVAQAKAVDAATGDKTSTVRFRGDEKGVRSMGDAFGELSSGIRNTGTVLRASSIPLGIAAIGTAVPVVSAAAASTLGLAHNLGKGAAGFVLIGGAAGGAGYGGLSLYAKGISSVVSASREAYTATHEHRMELLEKRRQEILNTRASRGFNAEIDRQLVGLTELQAAVGSRIFPMFAAEMRAWGGVMRENRGEIVDTAGAAVEAGAGFSRWFRTADEGRVLDRTLGFVNSSTVKAAQALAAGGRVGVSALQPLIPLSRRLQDEMLGSAEAAARWAESGEGQRRLGRIYRDLDAEMRRTGRTALTFGTGIVRTFDAIDEAGLSDQSSRGLAVMARRFADTTREGTGSRRTLDGFLADSRETMPFVGRLAGTAANQFFRVADSLASARQKGSRLTILQTTLEGVRGSLKPVANLLISTTKSLGPELGPGVKNVAELGEVFAGSSGPLVTYVRFLNRMASTFNDLPPDVKSTVANLAAAKFIFGTLGVGAVVAPMGRFASNMFIAHRAAGKLGGKAGLPAVAGGAGRLSLLLAGGIGLTALGGAFVYAYNKNERFREGVDDTASKLSSWTREKFAGAKTAVRDIFDLDVQKIREQGKGGATALTSGFQQKMLNEGNAAPGEGSASYEFGYKAVKGVRRGADAAFESKDGIYQLKWSDIFEAPSGAKSGFKGNSDAGGPIGRWIENAVPGAAWLDRRVFDPLAGDVNRGIDDAFRGTNWVKVAGSAMRFGGLGDYISQKIGNQLDKVGRSDVFARFNKAWAQSSRMGGGTAGTAAGVGFTTKLVDRIREGRQKTAEQNRKMGREWVMGVGWMATQTGKKADGIQESIVGSARRSRTGATKENRTLGSALSGIWKRMAGDADTKHGRIATTVGSMAARGREKGSAEHRGLEANLGNIWGRVEDTSVKVFTGVASAVLSNSKRGKEGGSARNRELESNLSNIWGRAEDSSIKLFSGIYSAISRNSARGKEQGSARNRELETNLRSIWGRVHDFAVPKWGQDIAGAIIGGSKKGKEGGGAAQRDLETNTKNIWGRIFSNSKPVWANIASHIIKKSWDTERGSTNAWGSLWGFVSKVLSALGIGGGSSGGSSPKAPTGKGQNRGAQGFRATGGTGYADGGIWNPRRFASGGVWIADRGGVGDGKTIGAITNEAGEREAIVNLERWTPESQKAADAINRNRRYAKRPDTGREHRHRGEDRHLPQPPGFRSGPRSELAAPALSRENYGVRNARYTGYDNVDERTGTARYDLTTKYRDAYRFALDAWNSGSIKMIPNGGDATGDVKDAHVPGRNNPAWTSQEYGITNNTALMDRYNASQIRSIATHEVGHTLGLNHGIPTPSVMNYASTYKVGAVPQPNDWDALGRLYGTNINGGSGSSGPGNPYGNLKGRVHDGGGGAGQYGPTNNSLWDSETFGRVIEVLKRFRVSANTYENHPPAAPQLAGKSADFWDYAGRGTAIAVGLGNRVRDYITNNLATGLSWTLGEGDAGHSGSDRHVHATWKGADPKVPNVPYRGGTGGGFSIPNPLQLLFERLWRPIQSFADSVFDPMKADPYWTAKAGGTLGANSVTSIHDWIDGKIPDTILGGSGSSAGGGGATPQGSGSYGPFKDQREVAKYMAGQAQKRGIPGELPVMTSLVESNLQTGPAVRFSDLDSAGPYQIRVKLHDWSVADAENYGTSTNRWFLDNAQTYKGQYDDSASGLGAWAQRVQGSAYPGRYQERYAEARDLIGYLRGGVIPGPLGKPVMVQAHAGERVLSEKNNASFEKLARSVESWGRRSAGPVRGDLGASLGGSPHDLKRMMREALEEADIEIEGFGPRADGQLKDGQEAGSHRYANSGRGLSAHKNNTNKARRDRVGMGR